MLDFIYIFLLIAGFFRYRDGCKRLRQAKVEDARYTQIPDTEIVEWWHKVSILDKKFGLFFKHYGFF